MNVGAPSPSFASHPPAGAAPQAAAGAPGAKATASAAAAPSAATSASTTNLSKEALALIDQLKGRDLEVRQHEQAHLAAAGGLATSGASYTYQRGPNGVDYAIGGEVNIDTSPGRTPEETIERARSIQAAALAPAEPSGADRSVAAQAQQMEAQARAELAQQQTQDATSRVERFYGEASAKSPAASPTLDIYA